MRPSDSENTGAAHELRMIGPWLRMLWGIAPPLMAVPAGTDGAMPAPWLSRTGIHLPPVPPRLDADQGANWLRAASAHAAAHLVFSRSVFMREGAAPVTVALTGLLEDARAEALAARELPGLARLWSSQHVARPEDGDDFEALMARLSRALADADYDDPHPWVRKGRAMFWQDQAQRVLRVPDARQMRALASTLGHDIGQMRMGFNLRMHRPQPYYRDDNRWLWHAESLQASKPQPAPAPATPRERTLQEPPPATLLSWRYPEWDHRAAVMRSDWCTVSEGPAPEADVAMAPVDASPPPLALVQALARAARDARSWQPHALSGDEIDLREAVQLAVLQRSGLSGASLRPYQRTRTVPRRMAAALLVDASASSAARLADTGARALDRQCAQAATLAQAMLRAGWRVSIHGFCSDGRHRVQMHRVLDYGAPWDAQAAARLAGLRAGLSTRLGAVLRHGTRHLAARSDEGRWVVVLGDGEPHDVDVHLDGHLAADAHAAVQAARRTGVHVVCLRPASEGGHAAQLVFGMGATAAAGPDVASWTRTIARLLDR
ncbi:hypothetical protein QTH91_15350 [Variovorax dokdonensis]|uniref:VWFA domain-containing protein n=1 Tax=Variovorax dokdonensis TaxID=344883 RepID=A0ABT7ND58_9BURK|nr:hypothetical protein [Variovorax dokdonensis]MDM0045863.1 hypothetical protein [Variovorax dokdonensis]